MQTAQNKGHAPEGTQKDTSPTPSTSSRILDVARRATKFLSSLVSGKESPHPDFRYASDGWFGNNEVSATFQLGYQPKQKVVFYFDETDVSLLDNCPYPAKFAPNENPEHPEKYFGLAYPQFGQNFEDLVSWAAQFNSPSVFTFGEFIGDRWVPGQFVRKIEPRDSVK